MKPNPQTTIHLDNRKRLMKLLLETLTEDCEFDGHDLFVLQDIYRAIDEFGADPA